MSDERNLRNQYRNHEKTFEIQNSENRKRTQRIRTNAQTPQRFKDQKGDADRLNRGIYQHREIIIIERHDEEMNLSRR